MEVYETIGMVLVPQGEERSEKERRLIVDNWMQQVSKAPNQRATPPISAAFYTKSLVLTCVVINHNTPK
jgi:hypothetical protein